MGDELLTIEQLSAEYYKKREELDGLKDQLAILEEEKRSLEARLVEGLAQCGKERWDLPGGLGTITVVERWSYKTPKTLDQKLQFFDYLKSKGCFEEIVSVNSQTLNAFCKRELDAAIDSGATDFKIPGIEDPSMSQTIQLRKK